MQRVLADISDCNSSVNSSYSRSFAKKSFTGNKSTPKKTLGFIHPRRSLCEERLLKIITSQPHEPLCGGEGEKENRKGKDNWVSLSPKENVPPNGGNVGLGICQSATRILPLKSLVSRDFAEISAKEMSSEVAKETEEKISSPKKVDPALDRLQRDLNSPSAGARCRALKALKSPTMSVYRNFDVPPEEQDILSTQEKEIIPASTVSLEDIMKDVIVYVEVRTGEDNRTDGVKKVISQMGAKVNDKLLRDTTHVVFKDGLLSTYNKAKKWNIPIVSILWIEECSKMKQLLPPECFPISNIDRYENPEFYEKIKRQKSMQPDAEDKRRRKTQKTENVAQKPDSRLRAAIRIPRKPKDKVDEILQEFHEKIMSTPEDNELPLNSKLLQMIRDSPVQTPQSKRKETDARNNLRSLIDLDSISKNLSGSDDDGDDDFVDESFIKTPKVNAKKTLTYNGNSNDKQNSRTSANKSGTSAESTAKKRKSMSTVETKKPTTNRRRTLFVPSTIQESLNEKEDNVNLEGNKTATTVSNSMSTLRENTPLVEVHANISTKTKSTRRRTLATSVLAGADENARNTTYAPEPLDITNTPNVPKTPIMSSANKSSVTRRTLYTPKEMDALVVSSQNRTEEITQPLAPNRQTITDDCNMDVDTLLDDRAATPQRSTLIDQLNNLTTFSSTRKPPSKRKTVFDISMEIIGQRIQNINSQTPSHKKRMSLIYESAQKVLHPISPSKVPPPVFQPASSLAENRSSLSTGTENGVRKKRKLFAPPELLLTPEPAQPSDNANLPNTENPKNTSASSAKKRSKEDDFEKSDKIKRRRTEIPKSSIKEKVPNVKSVEATKVQRNCNSSLDFESVAKTQNDLKAPPTTSVEKFSQSAKKLPFLVYTNMHSPQIDIIKQAVTKLGGFQIEGKVSDSTTHVVTLEVRRTMNILRGIIRGLWIVDFSWVEESLKNGKWLHEEIYEVRNFSRAVEICRSERQAFGKTYKMDLYADAQPFYISPQCKVPITDLKELITLCSGRTVESKRRAKYIIGEYCNKYPEKICLDPLWILDSISINKIKKTYKYLIKPE